MKFAHAAASLVAIALVFAAPAAEAQRHHPPALPLSPRYANPAFEQLSRQFIEAATMSAPTEATVLGEHQYDNLLPDISEQGRARRLELWRTLLSAADRLRPETLSRDNQVDYAMLRNELNYRIWAITDLQEWAWNPQYYNDIAAGSLYGLAARDFAPWDVRLKAATARMEALTRFLPQSREQLVVQRVPKVFAETVARQNSGVIEIADTMLVPHKGELNAADAARFDAALAGLRAAVSDQQHWLDSVLVPQAAGDFRIGARLYDQKMRFGLDSDITRAQLKAQALQAKAATRAEMYTLSRQALAGASTLAMPDRPTAAQQQAVIEAALALSYAHRPDRAHLEDRARETLAQATEFVRTKGLIRMPEGPVRVITMPTFQQGNAVAYNDPPGPFERGQQNFYAVSPVPADWTDAQATSFLSEYNDYMIQDLSIHEAMPGHYLQLDHSNRSPSTLRAYLGSGPFVEGWAVYAEGVMKDQGYLGENPQDQRLFALTVLKMRLRSITNTLLDIGIHTEGMSRDEAMALMQQGAFQQEREAAGKWIRASLSSVQLLSYFTGYEQHLSLRAEAQRRWGRAFTLRRYHDTVLSYGSPPAKHVRSLMFGEAVR